MAASRKSQEALQREALKVLSTGKRTLADDKKASLAASAAAEAYDSAAYIAKLSAAGLAQRFLNAAARAIRAGVLDPSDISLKKLEAAAGYVLSAAQSHALMRDTMLETFTIGKFNAALEDSSIEYVMILTKRDSRVREAHRKYHGLILRKDDPQLPAYLPPNGYGCRCWFKTLTARQAERMLATMKNPLTTPPPADVVVDKGFNLTPEQRVEKLARRVEEALTSL